MKISILAFPLLSCLALSVYAAPILTETHEILVKTPSDLQFQCSAGLAPNGHNYPTSSSFTLSDIDLVVPDTNVYQIGTDDPQVRLGDHCAELASEFASILPAKLVVTRTLTEEANWIDGVCVQGYDEELVGKIGSYTLMGSDYFSLGPVQATQCAGS